MNAFLASLHPTLIRSCALGEASALPRRMALQLLASSTLKQKVKDLSLVMANGRESSGVRMLAAQLLLSSEGPTACGMLLHLLRQEQHPRMVSALVQLIGRYGEERAYDQLKDLATQRAWPGSARPALAFALILLRHRCGISHRGGIKDQRVAPAMAVWRNGSFPLKAARASYFAQVLRFARQSLSGTAWSEAYAAEYRCLGKEFVLIFSEETNQPSFAECLGKPLVLGAIVAMGEVGCELYAWVLCEPDSAGNIHLRVYGEDGRQLYRGQGELCEGVLHFSFQTVPGAGVPGVLLSGGFRRNQLLSAGLLRVERAA